MRFTIFALVFLVIGIVRDYQRDKGQNVKAKIFHAICLTLLVVSYAGSFQILGMLIRDFEGAQKRFSTNVGLVPGQVHWIIYLVHSAVVMTIIILAYQMIRRNEKSRKLLVKLLPLAGLLEVFSFYRGWVSEGDDLGVGFGAIMVMALVIVGGITTFIFWVYTSEFMKTFFSLSTVEKTVDVQTVVVEQNEAQRRD